jgi:hypothetical protein
MANDTYNGWTNRETWLVQVQFDPESRADVEYAYVYLYELKERLPPFFQDYIDLSRINWDELMDQFDEPDDGEEDE